MSQNTSNRQMRIADLLKALPDGKGMTRPVIEETLGLEPTSATHSLKGLIDRGIVTRKKSLGGEKAPILYFYNHKHTL